MVARIQAPEGTDPNITARLICVHAQNSGYMTTTMLRQLDEAKPSFTPDVAVAVAVLAQAVIDGDIDLVEG